MRAISHRILLVDDDPAVLRAYERVLVGAGHQCAMALDARVAIQKAREEQFDFAITDLRMPGIDEVEHIEALGRAAPRMRIIVVTGHPSLSTAIAAIRASVVDYMLKPVRAEALLNAVSQPSRRGEPAAGVRSLRAQAAAQKHPPAELEAALEGRGEGPVGGVGSRPVGPPLPSGFDARRLAALSRREAEILQRFSRGERLPDIARALKISSNTARNHMKSIFGKLGVRSQVELAVLLTAATLRP